MILLAPDRRADPLWLGHDAPRLARFRNLMMGRRGVNAKPRARLTASVGRPSCSRDTSRRTWLPDSVPRAR
jgi:hypothetical protein